MFAAAVVCLLLQIPAQMFEYLNSSNPRSLAALSGVLHIVAKFLVFQVYLLSNHIDNVKSLMKDTQHVLFFYNGKQIYIKTMVSTIFMFIVKTSIFKCSKICSAIARQLPNILHKMSINSSVWHYWYELKVTYVLSINV